jgi:integrase
MATRQGGRHDAVARSSIRRNALTRITAHDLRHTAASLAISAGANVKAVQRMLGHARASMTPDVYADLFDADLDAVAARLDSAIETAADALRTGDHLTGPLTSSDLRVCGPIGPGISFR